MSLQNQTIDGLKWTGLSTLIVSILQVLSLAILSHFLSPQEFGLMAILMVVIGFCQSFMDMGISNGIIHKQNISHIQLSSLYWLNAASGIVLAAILVVLAPLITFFYTMPDMTGLLQILCISFIISGFSNQFRILCQKEMEFKRMANAEILSAIAGMIISVVLAMQNHGVYALLFGFLAQISISSIIFLYFGLRYHHRPAFIYKHSQIKNFINFGLFQMGEKSLNYFNTNFDILLIGKLLGPEATGIYSIAKTLAMRLAQIIAMITTKVTVPLMAKIQDNETMLRDTYYKTILYIALFASPIFILLALLAEPFIKLTFGSAWSESAILLQILSLMFLLRATDNPLGSLLIAKGRADLGFYWNLALFIILPLSIFMGSFNGVIGIAFALLTLQAALKYPSWQWIIKPLCDLDFWSYTKAFLFPLILAIIAAAIAVPFTFIINEITQILSVVLVIGCTYTVFLWFTHKDLLYLIFAFLKRTKP